MGIDWKSLLLENKDSFINIPKENVDESLDFLGARRKKVKDRVLKANLFKHYITEINAKLIWEKIQKIKEIDESKLNNLEREIIDFGRSILEEGQNPVEMIVYSTKGLDLSINKNFESALRILKNICNSNFEARKALISILEDWTWTNQLKLVIETIKEIKEANAYEGLISLLNDDNLKENAAECLIELRDERAIDSILDMVNSLNGFNAKEKDIAFRIIVKLAQFGENATKHIIERYLDNENKSLNIVYSNVISRLKDMAVESMANLLYDDKYSQKAAITLGKMRTGSATKYLLAALYDPNIENKINIIIGLGYTKDTECIEHLTNILNDEKQTDEVKRCVITSLANIQAIETKEMIKKFLDNEALCINAFSALVQLGEINYLSNLFMYLVKPGLNSEHVLNAIKEIKRLRGLKLNELNKQITDGIKYIIQNDDGYACINTLKIIDTNLDDNFAKELLVKLNNTKKEEIQYMIYKILGKHAGLLKNIINERVFLDAYESTSTRIRYLAQKIIEDNYKYEDKLIRI